VASTPAFSETMKTAFMILIIVLSTSAGEVLIAKGLKQVGEISTLNPGLLVRLGWRIMMNSNVLQGVLSMAVSFLAFLTVLSWENLSYTVPATSLSYVMSTLGAKFVLKERINRYRWVGTVLVGFGILLISLP
jgi:bacterial/archaeal transporter family protein